MRVAAAIAAVVTSLSIASAAETPGTAALEKTARATEAKLLKELVSAFERRDAAAYAALFSPSASASSWSAARKERRSRGGISESAWTKASAVSGKELEADAAAYFASYEKIEDADARVLDAARGADGLVRIKAYLDVRGHAAGARRTDRGALTLSLDGEGRVARLEREDFETLTAAKPAFEDATKTAGLNVVLPRTRREAIRRGGYALSAGDYDGDGRPDLYVGGSGAGQLLRNTGDGKFEDATKAAGLGKDTMVKAALIADLDDDGKADLTLQRFVEGSGPELIFYRNDGKRFVNAKATVERKRKHDRAMSIAAGDFNGDGRLDLYVGYPGVRDFTDARGPGDDGIVAQALYINKGGWKFEEAVDASQPGFFSELVRPHSALAFDADEDGKTDLLVVDDRGFSSRLYLGREGGSLAHQADALGLRNAGWGMMAVAGDYDGDGREDVYFSNIDFSAGRRFLKLAEREGLGRGDVEKARLAELAASLGGNRLYRAVGEGRFVETTARAGVGFAGEAPGGAEWVDYDGDGMLDLYVANGLWSDDPARDYTGDFLDRQAAGLGGAGLEEPGKANPVMRHLLKSRSSFAGYQRNRLFRNDGDGRFTEVGWVTGADRVEDGYVAAVADFDQDGRPDLALRNADPPHLDRAYPPVVLLHNVSEGARALVVTARLKNGAPAVGARVTAVVGERMQTRELRGTVGAVQSEAAAFFGLGSELAAKALEVRWPSGRVDRFSAVPAGRVELREGEATLRSLTTAARPR